MNLFILYQVELEKDTNRNLFFGKTMDFVITTIKTREKSFARKGLKKGLNILSAR